MRPTNILAVLPLMLCCTPAPDAPMALSPADEAAVFRAAGFTRIDSRWRACDDPGSLSYTPGAIQEVRDVNGDGRREVVVTEGSVACYGRAEQGYHLVSEQSDGSWKSISSGNGMLMFLSTTGVGNWPDIEIGGPGFCFPVLRWNGTEYLPHRREHEGEPCT